MIERPRAQCLRLEKHLYPGLDFRKRCRREMAQSAQRHPLRYRHWFGPSDMRGLAKSGLPEVPVRIPNGKYVLIVGGLGRAYRHHDDVFLLVVRLSRNHQGWADLCAAVIRERVIE